MSFHSWLYNFRSIVAPSRGQRHHRRRGAMRAATRGRDLEALEDRCLLNFSPAVSYLVGGTPVDPWVQSQPVVTADFNNDTVPDLAVASYHDGTSRVSVLRGNADGSFRPALNTTTGVVPLSLAVGDFNADGKPDLATADGYDVSVLLGNGDGTFQAPASISLGDSDYPQAVAVGDFNGDGKMDLGVTSNTPYYYYLDYGYANVLLGHGDGSFSGPNMTELGYGHHYAAVTADLNSDGFDDFMTVNSYQNRVDVLFGASGGYLQGPSSFAIGNDPQSVAAGDLDGDGDFDLVTANLQSGNVSVLLGNGAGSFSAAGNYAAGSDPAALVLGDFNGDGKVDVATGNSGSTDLSVLPGRGDGTLSPSSNFAVGSSPSGVAAGDFNGDGWLDAATANNDGEEVSVLINDHAWPPANAPSVTINDVTVTEGNTGSMSATFTVTLSSAYGTPITVHYATANGTATAGSDYSAGSGDVTFAAGQTTRTITVAVLGDRLPEPTETFVVNLTTSDAFITKGQGAGTILDNEPRISINDVSKKEGNGTGTTLFVFTISLSAAYDQAVTFNYATADGTATTADHDYQANSGTVMFLPGETTKTITITVYCDKKAEPNETFFVNLSGASSNALFDDMQGIGTILDDDRKK